MFEFWLNVWYPVKKNGTIIISVLQTFTFMEVTFPCSSTNVSNPYMRMYYLTKIWNPVLLFILILLSCFDSLYSVSWTSSDAFIFNSSCNKCYVPMLIPYLICVFFFSLFFCFSALWVDQKGIFSHSLRLLLWRKCKCRYCNPQFYVAFIFLVGQNLNPYSVWKSYSFNGNHSK